MINVACTQHCTRFMHSIQRKVFGLLWSYCIFTDYSKHLPQVKLYDTYTPSRMSPTLTLPWYNHCGWLGIKNQFLHSCCIVLLWVYVVIVYDDSPSNNFMGHKCWGEEGMKCSSWTRDSAGLGRYRLTIVETTLLLHANLPAVKTCWLYKPGHGGHKACSTWSQDHLWTVVSQLQSAPNMGHAFPVHMSESEENRPFHRPPFCLSLVAPAESL